MSDNEDYIPYEEITSTLGSYWHKDFTETKRKRKATKKFLFDHKKVNKNHKIYDAVITKRNTSNEKSFVFRLPVKWDKEGNAIDWFILRKIIVIKN